MKELHDGLGCPTLQWDFEELVEAAAKHFLPAFQTFPTDSEIMEIREEVEPPAVHSELETQALISKP